MGTLAAMSESGAPEADEAPVPATTGAPQADRDRREADRTEAELDTVAEALEALDADDLERAEQLADSLTDGATGAGAPSDED